MIRRAKMSMRTTLALSLLPVFSLAQSTDTANQRVIEELRGVRAMLEKSQRVLVALVRIQIDESRLAALEAERQRLLTQEQGLSDEIDKAAVALRNEDNRQVPTFVQSVPGSEPVMRIEPHPARSRHAEATRRIQEVRGRKLNVEQSITGIKDRIAAWEKHLDEMTK
jgi:hypothetical protein